MGIPLLSILLSFFVVAYGQAPSATIEAGVVIGTTTRLAGATITVNKFLGIPFAASPTRFAPPSSPIAFSSAFNAGQFGPACIQQFNYPEAARNASMAVNNNPPPPAGESENCLNLNIYVPGTNTTGKTVMVWIYGGSLQFGSNSVSIYDGTSFATYQQVILVTINYRLSVFGFPGPVPQLPVTGTNLGFQDQRFALEWIRRNIAAFGGDPGKVTIFGQSAGAASVDNLIVTTPNNPPFRAAIMESGSNSIYTNRSYTVPTPWNTLVAAINCTNSTDVLACVRAVPATTIKNVVEMRMLTFNPFNDNVTSLVNPQAARLAGNIAKVPIMTGTNANEGRSFVVGITNTTAYLTSVVGPQTAYITALEQAFPIGSPGISNDYDQSAQIFTEVIFQCPAAAVANNTRTIGVPTWRYYYNASFANIQPLIALGIDLKSYHAAELPLVFNTYTNPPIVLPATQFEGRLSEFMQASWATFARNPYGGPGWAGYPQVAALGTGATTLSSGAGMLRSVINSTGLDLRCNLFAPIYMATGMG